MRRHCWGESFFIEPMRMRKTDNSSCRSISLLSRSSIGRPDSWLPSFAKQRPAVCIDLVRVAASLSAPASIPQAAQLSGIKTTCKQIGTFARAQELLRQGHSYLDRNGDGVACEGLR